MWITVEIRINVLRQENCLRKIQFVFCRLDEILLRIFHNSISNN